MYKMKINTKGELLLIAVSNFDMLTLTKYEGDVMQRLDSGTPRKKIITDEKKHAEANNVSTLLEPFLDKKHPWYRALAPTLKNTESQKDFDPRKLFEFKEICIESLKEKLTFFSDALKDSKSYLKIKEEIAKEKNKIPQIKKVSKDIQDYKFILNQINNMIQIFSDAENEDDLIKLELFSK